MLRVDPEQVMIRLGLLAGIASSIVYIAADFIAAAAFLSTYMTSLLFNVQPTDPAVYAVVALVLMAVAMLASYLPARRASRIDPLIALRDE